MVKLRRRKWAVLISGRGSNLAAAFDCLDAADIALVVSSKPNAYGLLRARRAGVASTVAPLVAGTNKIDFAELERLLKQRSITHVFLLGFMKIVPISFIQAFSGRILNLHPSLLPLYPGLDSIARAWRDNAPLGATVHDVVAQVDAGRRLCAREVSLSSATSSLESAEYRVHIVEQVLVRSALTCVRSVS